MPPPTFVHGRGGGGLVPRERGGGDADRGAVQDACHAALLPRVLPMQRRGFVRHIALHVPARACRSASSRRRARRTSAGRGAAGGREAPPHSSVAQPVYRTRTQPRVAACASWSSTTRATVALVSSSRSSPRLAAMPVGVDQPVHGRGGQRRPRGRDEEQSAVLAQARAPDRLDPDRSPVDLELHLAAADEPDPVAERAGDDEAPCPVDGRPHGSDNATRGSPATWPPGLGAGQPSGRPRTGAPAHR
jgi:hypothetical protein